MKTCVIWALAMLVCTESESSSLEPSDQLIAKINAALKQQKVEAVVVATYVDGDTRIWGFGQTGDQHPKLPDGETIFEIGSVSKVFTSLLAQRQVELGRLAWDQSIASRLEGLGFASTAVAGITLRELSTHQSGLPRMPANFESEDPLDPYRGYGRGELMAFLSGFSPQTLTREYAYSNLGAGLLGVIAADAAGLPYGGAMSRDIAQPLGLSDTATALNDAQRGRLTPGFSDGARMPNWSGFDALAGAGALLSTANDLLKFIDQNFNPTDSALGSTLEAALTIQPDTNMGLGWHLQTIAEGDVVFWHNGGTGGYASMLALRPKTREGVILLTSSTAYDQVTQWGFELMRGNAVAGTPDIDLEPYVGSYELAPGFVLSVTSAAGQLYGQATGQGRFELTYQNTDSFVFPAADVRIEFKRVPGEQASSLVMYQGGRTTHAARVADEEGLKSFVEIEIDPSILADYAGKYRLGPGAVFDVRARNGELLVRLGQQDAFPVFAHAVDQFFYRVVDAQLTFERDSSGKVIALILHQGGDQRAVKED